ncbi:lipid-A-disaccharide synthase [Geopsychrobacter electrodiphilus]|uniref:lipid-A-disaccharide synthase n=1 Tax=Geopsychrobacter electrodiphilus TaxID=225196 RepID=UPI00036F3BA7|nr:lipid-A-disaccharide synthase [Geopsychrobacter electrodiphilus]
MHKDVNPLKKVMIVAGESSGDLHGGNLIQAAKEQGFGLSFYGVGGRRMREAGCRILFPAEDLAVMGLVEVVGHLPTIRNRFKRLEAQLRGAEKPDLLLLIDYPGFNLRLAKVAREVGVPVLYYIAPKVWAWKKGRIKTIGERVNQLALIFPFEPPLYANQPLNATYVGNPLLDEFDRAQPITDLRQRLNVSPSVPLIGLFPGSRKSELKFCFATLIETAHQILQQKPEARFVLPVAPSLDLNEIKKLLAGTDLPIELSQESIYAIASACNAVLCVSGTVTLQTALCRTPMVVIYKAAFISYLVGSLLVKIPYFSLVNIVAERGVVREFLQYQANAENLTAELLRLLDDQEYREQIIQGLEMVCYKLGQPGTSKRVARMAADICFRKE